MPDTRTPQAAHLWVLAVCALVLSACGPLAATGVPLIGEADVLTVVGTDKSIIDHVVSYSSGKDCSTVRREKGLHYCVEDEPDVTPEVYCYNTLGTVTCYDRPDPYGNGSQKVGESEHNMPKRTVRRR